MPDARTFRRRVVKIALAAVVPAWIFRSAVLLLVLRTEDEVPWRGMISVPALLIPTVSLALCVGIVVLLRHRDLFRSDQWWLAGGLFVLATAAATALVEAPTAGEGLFVDFTLSLLAGPWLITFAAGAYTWRYLTPAYPPLDWVQPPADWDE